MKKNHYSTLIALAFFAGTFLIVFTTEDSNQAAIRFVAYLFLSCGAALGIIFKDKIKAFMEQRQDNSSKIDAVLSDAEQFSKEFGDVYVMADKLKQSRKNKTQIAVSGKK